MHRVNKFMPYELHAYSIKKTDGEILYIGRRTPGDYISHNKAEQLLKKFQEQLEDDSIYLEVEGVFTRLVDCTRFINEMKVLSGLSSSTKPITPVAAGVKRRQVTFSSLPQPKDSPNRPVTFSLVGGFFIAC